MDNSAGRTPSKLLQDAADPATPPARLRRILDIADRNGTGDGPGTPRRALLEALAANPNCPPDVLARLTTLLPERALDNPALPLVALEAPNFAQGITTERARELMRGANASPLLLALLANDASRPLLAEEARLHVGLAGEFAPGEEWRAAVRTWYTEALRVAAAYDRAGVEELADIGAVTGWIAGAVAAAGGSVVKLPDDIDEVSLAGMPEPAVTVLRAVIAEAKDPATPPERRAELLRDPRRAAKVGLAMNPALTVEEMRALAPAFRSDGLIGFALVRHPEVPPELLTAFARHHHMLLRRLALRHPSLPAGARAGARREVVRQALGDRRGGFWRLSRFAALLGGRGEPMWESALHRAATSDRWEARLAAALVPLDGTPLPALAEDGNRYVRAAASARLAEPDRPEELAAC